MYRMTPEFLEMREKANAAFYSLVEKLMTLSAGALGLSVALRETFFPASPSYLWLLPLSWLGFVITILCGVAIFWGKQKIFIEISKDMWNNPDKNSGSQRPNLLSRLCVPGAYASFALAITTLMVFATLNI